MAIEEVCEIMMGKEWDGRIIAVGAGGVKPVGLGRRVMERRHDFCWGVCCAVIGRLGGGEERIFLDGC